MKGCKGSLSDLVQALTVGPVKKLKDRDDILLFQKHLGRHCHSRIYVECPFLPYHENAFFQKWSMQTRSTDHSF